MANWPENTVPKGQRNTMWVQGSYDTGEVRDGHKIIRNVCEEDGIDVIHPPQCSVPTRDLGAIIVMEHYDCPWAAALEGETVEELHESSDRPFDQALPVGVEVEVVWRSRSWRGWTDYGWEGDAEFSWWAAPASRETDAPKETR